MAPQERTVQKESVKILNLSDTDISANVVNILKKGLKFTPTPRSKNNCELGTDIKRFSRKLRLAEHYENKEYIPDDSLIKLPGKFNPQPGKDPVLDTYIDFLNKYPLDENIPKGHSNITNSEYKDLIELSKNSNIIIKEADKGGATVIMNSSYYESKILEMLNDKLYYKKIPANVDNQVINKIRRLSDKYSHCLTKSESKCLTEFNFKTSQFYGLPKIHKSKQISSAINKQNSDVVNVLEPSDLPFRPIVGGPICPTSNLSFLLDEILKPLLSKVQSFVRDDIDFLSHLPKKIKKGSKFVTFDVTSLYTNIPHDLGVKAIKYWLSKYPNLLPSRFSEDFIVDAIKIVLENNIFQFGDCFYLQILGTAMGTKFAPTYASLVLAYLEECLYKMLESHKGISFSNYIKANFKRYLDDCFLIWDGTFGNEKWFLELLNSLNHNIQFTMEASTESIPFLDVLVINRDGNIHTDIYHKPTDTKQYVHFSSCHPHHTKVNIPFNLARRICTIVSEYQTRTTRLKSLKQDLEKRGYPVNIIDNGIKKALEIDRTNILLKPKQKQNDTDILTFVNTFNPRNINFFSVIRNNIEFLNSSEKMNNVLHRKKIINSRRQPNSLKQMLVKSRYTSDNPNSPSPMVKKCGRSNCGTCEYLLEGSSVVFKNGFQFNIKYNMTCATSNLIYVLICNGCGEQYIGETGRTLRNRVALHKNQINTQKYRHLKVSKHVHNCARQHTEKFKIFPFYKVNDKDTIWRRNKEDYFVKLFKPHLNSA